MTDVKRIAEMLQDNEIILLKELYKKEALSSFSKLSQIEFMRAGMWLENKGIVSQKKEKATAECRIKPCRCTANLA